jgi:hypothetical protein
MVILIIEIDDLDVTGADLEHEPPILRDEQAPRSLASA